MGPALYRNTSGFVAVLDGVMILSSVRNTRKACMEHLAEDLGIDIETMLARGYTFHECTLTMTVHTLKKDEI